MAKSLPYHSYTLADRYVFYERLNEGVHPQDKNLYSKIKGSLETFSEGTYGKGSEIAARIRGQARAEREKETALIQKIFGVSDLEFDLENPNATKDLIEAVNSFLNFRSSYKYVLQLLLKKNEKGRYVKGKPTTGWLSTYLEKAIEGYKPKIVEETNEGIRQHMQSNHVAGVRIKTVLRIFHDVLAKNKDYIMQAALQLAMGTDVKIKGTVIKGAYADDPEERARIQEGYSDILASFNDLPKNNPLVQSLVKLYRLDDFFNELDNFLNVKNNEISIGKLNSNQIKVVLKNKTGGAGNDASIAGFAQEDIATYVVNKLAETGGFTFGNNEIRFNGQIEAKRIGNLKMRDDELITVSDNGTLFREWEKASDKALKALTDEGKKGSMTKEKSIEYWKKVQENLDQIPEGGFIIHMSSKMYNIIAKSFGGYQGMSGMTLDTLEMTLEEGGLGARASAIIPAILQMEGGAIGESMGLRETLSNALAEDIAYILFDDVGTIADSLASTGSIKNIHVFDLNTIKVPLSVFLNYLADSIEETTVRDAVTVTIRNNDILYPEPNGHHGEGISLTEAWKKQASYSINNIRISYRFLRKIHELLEQFQ